AARPLADRPRRCAAQPRRAAAPRARYRRRCGARAEEAAGRVGDRRQPEYQPQNAGCRNFGVGSERGLELSVASLLVYVKAKRLESMLPERVRGAVWPVRAADFHHTELDRLDDQSTLFVVTVDADRAVLVAYLDGPRVGHDTLGDAAVCDDDITYLI